MQQTRLHSYHYYMEEMKRQGGGGRYLVAHIVLQRGDRPRFSIRRGRTDPSSDVDFGSFPEYKTEQTSWIFPQSVI